MKLSKRVKAIREKVDLKKEYTIEEAIKVLKETANAKFNESFDCAIN